MSIKRRFVGLNMEVNIFFTLKGAKKYFSLKAGIVKIESYWKNIIT